MLTGSCRTAFRQVFIRRFRWPGLVNFCIFIFLLLAFPALAPAQSCPADLGGVRLNRGSEPICENEAKGTTCKLSCIYDNGGFTRLSMSLYWFKRADPPPNPGYKNWVIDGRCTESTDPTTINHPTKQVWAYMASLKTNGEREAATPIREMMTMVEGQASNCAPDSGSTARTMNLKFFDPFDHLSAGVKFVNKPSGDLVANVPDVREGSLVAFWVEPGDGSPDAPGNNLYGLLPITPNVQNRPSVNFTGETPNRKYLGVAFTAANGEASLNILGKFHPHKFMQELLRQNYRFDVRGKISGTMHAAVFDERSKTFNRTVSIPVEFKHVAVILKISGEGRPDNVEQWRHLPGRVRVKREGGIPKFDFKPVDGRFRLLPFDIISIDGNASVEIAWFNGDRIIASVRDTIAFDDTEIQPPQARLIIGSDAWASGFPTRSQRTASTFFGFGASKGIEAMIEAVPVVGKALKEGGELMIELYNDLSASETNFEEMKVMTRVRVRSRLLIDNSGNVVKVFNIEGSPDIKTATGGLATLQAGNMVAVSKDGRMGTPQPFDQAAVEASFVNQLGTAETAQKTKTDDKDGKDGKSEKAGVEAKNSDQRVYCNVLFNEKVIRTICEKGDDKGVPIDLYYYETPGVVSVPGVDGGRRLYNRFVRAPSVDHKDQSNVRWYHAYWVFSQGEWRIQADVGAKVEVLGRVP